jgi:ubiquinone/menaquinone biosynthesis C-methylase UbiE
MGFLSYRDVLEKSAKERRHRLTPYREFIDFILQYVRGRCLEIGCGDGIWTDSFRKNCSRLVSIDLSKIRVTKARGRVENLNVNFVVCDAVNLPFKEGIFDSICALEVIEHLPDYNDHSRFLREICRVLSRDGVFIISTPNKPLHKLYCRITNDYDFTHYSEINYFQFKRILKKHFSRIGIYGKFGWLSAFYSFFLIRKIHKFLSRLTPFCRQLIGVCRKN